MHRPIIQVILAVLALQFGTSATAAELLVSAAASLTNAFSHIGQEFEQTRPGTLCQFLPDVAKCIGQACRGRNKQLGRRRACPKLQGEHR